MCLVLSPIIITNNIKVLILIARVDSFTEAYFYSK